MKKTKVFSRALALLLSLILLFSMALTGVQAAVVDEEEPVGEMPTVMEGLMDIGVGFSWAGGESVSGAVNGGVAVIGFIFSMLDDGPSFEEVLMDYLQEMRTEIVGKLDNLSLQVDQMERELKDFIMLAFKLEGFDSAYEKVEQRFAYGSATNFSAQVSSYIKDDSLSDEAKAELLSSLVGSSTDWNTNGTVIYDLDTYKNYLLGQKAVFNTKNIYEAAIEYYKDDALLGQEVLDRYDNEFAGKVYATYMAAVPKVLVCLQTNELLLRKQAQELRAQAEELGDNSKIVEAEKKEKEAGLCHLKEIEYVQSLIDIYELCETTRATVHPYDYYDRSDPTSAMTTRILSPELCKRDFYNEALEVHKKKAGKDADLSDSDTILFVNSWYNTCMLGDKQYPAQTSLLPTLQQSLNSTGLSDESRKYFVDHIIRTHPDKTVRTYLTDYGFNADTDGNDSAGVIAVDSKTLGTDAGGWESSAFCYYGKKVTGIEFAKLGCSYYELDKAAPEYNKDNIYSAGGNFDAVRYAPVKKNAASGSVPPALYLKTAAFDTTNIKKWIAEGGRIENIQKKTGKYTNESYSDLRDALFWCVYSLYEAEQDPSTSNQGTLDKYTTDLIHAICDMKVREEYFYSWKYLQSQIDNDNDSGVIRLFGDCTAEDDDEALTIPAGKEIYLDLNGYKLDRGLADKEARNFGRAITNNGNLTIYDSSKAQTGVITGGHSNNGGGAIANNGGTLTIEGGTITGNSVVAAGKNGGAIYLTGTLNITGGTITGNYSKTGNGGGIYYTGKDTVINISGSPVITGNTAYGGDNDLFISNDSIGTVNITGELDKNARIGICENSYATNPAFTVGLPGRGTLDNFVNNNEGKVDIVYNEEGEACTVPLLMGDVNSDGYVDIIDATFIQKYADDRITFTSHQLAAGDVNRDGKVDVLDAALIQKYAVNKIDKF